MLAKDFPSPAPTHITEWSEHYELKVECFSQKFKTRTVTLTLTMNHKAVIGGERQ